MRNMLVVTHSVLFKIVTPRQRTAIGGFQRAFRHTLENAISRFEGGGGGPPGPLLASVLEPDPTHNGKPQGPWRARKRGDTKEPLGKTITKACPQLKE